MFARSQPFLTVNIHGGVTNITNVIQFVRNISEKFALPPRYRFGEKNVW